MPKSERQRQKKADAKKRRGRELKAKGAKRDRMNQALDDFRRKAPMIKRFLKQRGHEWKFYDFLDSYADALRHEIAQAPKQCPSLLGVYEVEDDDYYTSDHGSLLASLGFSGLKQLFFNGKDVGEDYTAKDKKSNINGSTTAFRDDSDQLRTLVLIRKRVANVSTTDSKYVFKLFALFHELGHVTDWEQGIHLREGDVAVLDAEVYAHEFGLRKLMEGDYRAALSTVLPAFEGLQTANDFRKKVADRIVESDLFVECQECAKENWGDYLDAEDASETELLQAAGTLSELKKFC